MFPDLHPLSVAVDVGVGGGCMGKCMGSMEDTQMVLARSSQGRQ